MAEKTLEFEAGVAGDNVTAGAGNASGLNSVVVNAGTAKYDTAAAFFGSLGVMVTNAAAANAVIRQLIDPPGTTATTTATRMSYTYCVTLPSTVPAEVENFWQMRFLPSSGGAKISYWTDGSIRLQAATAGAGGIIIMSAADRAALSGRQFRVTLQFDAQTPNSITAALYTIKFYNNAGTQVGTTATGTLDLIGAATGTAMAGHDLGRVNGFATARGYGFDHMGINNGALVEIAPASNRLASPAVVLVDTTNPTTVGGLNGTVEVSWAAISGANRYDAYKAVVAGSPAEGDFVLYATNVVSPYQFTGQGAGTAHYGIKAVV